MDDDDVTPGAPDTTNTEVADALNNDESANQLAGAQARIAQLEAELATLTETLTKVQAHNYTLLTDGPPAGTTDSTAVNSAQADNGEGDPADIDIDDLFD